MSLCDPRSELLINQLMAVSLRRMCLLSGIFKIIWIFCKEVPCCFVINVPFKTSRPNAFAKLDFIMQKRKKKYNQFSLQSLLNRISWWANYTISFTRLYVTSVCLKKFKKRLIEIYEAFPRPNGTTKSKNQDHHKPI